LLVKSNGLHVLAPAEVRLIRTCLHPDSMVQIKRALVEDDSSRIAQVGATFQVGSAGVRRAEVRTLTMDVGR